MHCLLNFLRSGRTNLRALLIPILSGFALNAFAQACLIESSSEQLTIKLCQQNRTIPKHLFETGFCQPDLAGQTTEVTFLENCPSDYFGICQQATTAGTPYQQDIFYYGVASDSRFLQPACEQQNNGTWVAQ